MPVPDPKSINLAQPLLLFVLKLHIKVKSEKMKLYFLAIAHNHFARQKN